MLERVGTQVLPIGARFKRATIDMNVPFFRSLLASSLSVKHAECHLPTRALQSEDFS